MCAIAGRSRRTGLWTVAGIVICYVATLAWVHALVRTQFNVDYFEQYVVLRCTAEHTAPADRPRSRDELVEVAQAARHCQGLEVEVDGVWGGIYGTPSVRLKILAGGGATTTLAYYSVDVGPLSGIASIRYGLSPALYYLNL